MTVRFTVQTNGRATDCGIEQSSGNARLDEATCRAIERRYRFRPALDEDDKPLALTVVEDHRRPRPEDCSGNAFARASAAVGLPRRRPPAALPLRPGLTQPPGCP